MTAFVKDNFNTSSEYVHYYTGTEAKFVARFKYARGSKASFVSFLIKNFSVEEYFGRISAGESPLPILQSKGFVQPHVKKMLKEMGYDPTIAGYNQYVNRVC